ncbi:MAG: PmoA family protein [Verrucomicrobiota bacterium]
MKKGEAAAGGFEASETDAAITLSYDGAEFLTYHKAEMAPPEGVDPVFKRSGFIHPLKTPSGAVVTGIHPADHYHHLGFWHAWVNTKHGDDEHDFWNLKKKTGRVAYSKTISVDSTADEAGFVVEQLHIGYKGENQSATTILREEFTVKTRMVDGAFEVDYETKQTNVTDTALQLPAYRYGGPIAYRAPHHWKTANSDYLSSEGKTRIDGHTTRSRWISMFGPATEAEDAPIAAVTILGHSENHDAPQRMRVWPPNTHDGAIFFNYVPIQETEWALEPGKTSTMRYRLVAQDGEPDSEALDARWNRFTK